MKKTRPVEDDEDEKPKKKKWVDDDDEDEKPVSKSKLKSTATRVAENDDDDEDEDEKPSRKPVKEKTSGWGAVASRRVGSGERDEWIRNFVLKDGESAIIQFLNDEPFCTDGHNVKNARGRWEFQPCQKEVQKSCLMCSDDIRVAWKAFFKVIDYRGEWNKEKNRHTGGAPVEVRWGLSAGVAKQVKAQVDKRGKRLSELVFEVSRSGSGAQDTSYNFEIAIDEKTDKRIVPLKWKEKFPPLSEICQPLSDEELIERGFTNADED